MYKKDFFWEIGQKSGCSQRIVRLVFEGMLEVMKENLLKGEDIKFPGIFSIKVINAPECIKYSGFNDKKYICPPHRRLRFNVVKPFKDMLSEPTETGLEK